MQPSALVEMHFSNWRAAYRWERAVDRALSRWNLGHTRYMLLDALDRLQRRADVTQSGLTRLTQLTESGVHRAVMAMMERGLLTREIDEAESEWTVVVTDEGRLLLSLARPVIEALAQRFASDCRAWGV